MLKYILCEFYIFALEFTSLLCKLGSWVPEIRDEFLPKVETHQRKVFIIIGVLYLSSEVVEFALQTQILGARD